MTNHYNDTYDIFLYAWWRSWDQNIVLYVPLLLVSGLMVNLAFEEMCSPTLCCFISTAHLIDRVPTEPPPSRKWAKCTALSVWQLGFLHLRLTKSEIVRRKDSVIDCDRPFKFLLHCEHLIWNSHEKEASNSSPHRITMA